MTTFDTYNFDSDPKWKSYYDNLLIPDGVDKSLIEFKFKQKYYKTNIDSEYEIKTIPSASSTSSPNTSSRSSNTSSNTNSTSSSTSQRQTNTNTNNSSTSNTNTRPSQQQQSQQPPQPSSSANGQFTKFLYYAWIGAQVSTVIFTLFYLILNQPTYYYRSLLASLIGYLVPLFNTFEGRFNRSQIQVILKNDNAHFFGYSLMFYFLSYPSVTYLIPNFIYSLYHVLNRYNDAINRIPLISRLAPILVSKKQKAIEMAVSLEPMIFVLLILGLFTRTSSIILIVLYFRFLKLRYENSTLNKMIIQQYSNMVDHYINKPVVPAPIRNLVLKIKQFMSR